MILVFSKTIHIKSKKELKRLKNLKLHREIAGPDSDLTDSHSLNLIDLQLCKINVI